ncbi:hypothetical protein NLJ89_g8256 [Agrocybe chaxingu]|uniref:Uncharacterized protein n=1 Tax=Agrocybe chaxingu TaxID=84603 RepID=A0A9W8MUN8_9AGAR|nr:hypothetical protein NLJ89_g8256 [Agrocybe chaxingu]
MADADDAEYWPEISSIFYPPALNKLVAPPAEILTGLLPLLWKHRSSSFAQSLMRYAAETAHTHPLDTSSICETFGLLFSNDHVLALQIPNPDNEKSVVSFEYIAHLELMEEIDTRIHDRFDKENVKISPDNERISGALFSASLLRNRVSVLQRRVEDTILSGVCQFDEKNFNELDELYGVMSIIHIAVGGKLLPGSLWKRLPGGDIKEALRRCKEVGLFRTKGARELLEAAIANAESGYNKRHHQANLRTDHLRIDHLRSPKYDNDESHFRTSVDCYHQAPSKHLSLHAVPDGGSYHCVLIMAPKMGAAQCEEQDEEGIR